MNFVCLNTNFESMEKRIKMYLKQQSKNKIAKIFMINIFVDKDGV